MTCVDDTLNQCLFGMVKAIARVSDQGMSGIHIPVIVKHWSIDHRPWYFHPHKCCS
jgi:hypothetical protein